MSLLLSSESLLRNSFIIEKISKDYCSKLNCLSVVSGVCSSKVYKTAAGSPLDEISARAKLESITASSNNFSLTTHRNGFKSLNSHSCFDSSFIASSSVTLIVIKIKPKVFVKLEAKKTHQQCQKLITRKIQSELFLNSMQIRNRNCPIAPPRRRFMKHYYSLSISFSPEIFIRLIIFLKEAKLFCKKVHAVSFLLRNIMLSLD